MTDNAKELMQGKIIKGIAGFYYVDTGGGVYACRAKGLFRRLGLKPLVGDDCQIELTKTRDVEGNIVAIKERRNQLLRPPVVNVDQALILFAIVHPDPSYNLLDRFLISMRQMDLPVLVCFNKQDIASKEEQEILKHTYSRCGYQVLFISVKDGLGIGPLKKALNDRTTVIAGPSGAGKSSLINYLYPEAEMETGELSRKIRRGRNTTRHSELFHISGKGFGPHTFIMDTPGFTSLRVEDVTKEELQRYYPEFTPYEPGCRFTLCSHISEPDCAVKAAVAEGKISKIRYDNYMQIYREIRDRKPEYRKNK